MQQCEVLGNDALDLVGDENLIAVELNLVLLNLEVVAQLREVEYSRKVERIVDIHVDIEQRLLRSGVQFAVKCLVLLLRDVGGLASPEWRSVVDDVILVGIDILAILPLLNLAEGNLHRQEVAILPQQLLDLLLLAVLHAILRDMQHDSCSAVAFLLQFLHLILG